MKWNLFKKQLREEVKEYESIVDVNDIWKAIDSEVDVINVEAKRKFKNRYLFWFFGCLAISVVTLGYVQWNKDSNKINDIVQITSEESVLESSETQEVLSNKEVSISLVIEEGSNTVDEKTDSEINTVDEKPNLVFTSIEKEKQSSVEVLSVEKDISTKESKRNEFDDTQLQSEFEITEKTSKSAAKIKNFAESQNDDIVANKESELEIFKAILSAKKEQPVRAISLSIPAFKAETEHKSQSDNPLLPLESETDAFHDLVRTKEVVEETTPDNPKTHVNEVTSEPSSFTNFANQIPSINMLMGNALQKNLYDRDLGKHLQIPNTIEIHDKKRISFSVEPFGGYYAVQRKLIQEESGDSLLAFRRNQYEKALDAHTFGLNISVNHKSGFSFISGINYTNITEKYQKINTLTSIFDTLGIQHYRVNLYGETIAVYGQIIGSTTKTSTTKIYNRYKFLEIPLMIRYQKNLNRWNIGLQVGVFGNLSLKTSGRTYYTGGEFIDIDKQQDLIYRSRIGLSYSASLTFDYELSKQLSINFNPTIRYFPNDISLDTYSVSQKYTLYGLNVGLRCTF